MQYFWSRLSCQLEFIIVGAVYNFHHLNFLCTRRVTCVMRSPCSRMPPIPMSLVSFLLYSLVDMEQYTSLRKSFLPAWCLADDEHTLFRAAVSILTHSFRTSYDPELRSESTKEDTRLNLHSRTNPTWCTVTISSLNLNQMMHRPHICIAPPSAHCICASDSS